MLDLALQMQWPSRGCCNSLRHRSTTYKPFNCIACTGTHAQYQIVQRCERGLRANVDIVR